MSFRDFQKRMWLKMSKRIYKISPIIATKVLFLFSMKKRLNLENPKTFNEKIQWLKLYWRDPKVIMCADKYDLRLYVKKYKLDNILNHIYGVYKNAEEIEFDKLPERFVLKGTHGCGYNIICKNKTNSNINEIKNIADRWLKSNYAYISAEVQYQYMEPKIIAERYIEGSEEYGLIDYKIFCFNGEPKLTMVCEERNKDKRARFIFYDNDWNILPYNKDSKNLIKNKDIPISEKPKSFDKMLEYSKILSEEFPFVRIDFYEENGKPILGEMTFTPCGGIDSRLEKDIDLKLGNLIVLPKIYLK